MGIVVILNFALLLYVIYRLGKIQEEFGGIKDRLSRMDPADSERLAALAPGLKHPQEKGNGEK